MTDLRRIVIVGASLAGWSTARALRREGFSGSVTVVGEEVHPPYDRPPLSKELLLGHLDVAELHLDDADDPLEVDWVLGRRAVGLDPAVPQVRLGDGEVVGADAVVVATGSRARALPDLPPLPGVHTLRTVDDALGLRDDLVPGRRLVVVGAGFVGSEIASVARTQGLEVTLLEAAPLPLARALGTVGAGMLSGLHAEAGVLLRCGVAVAGLQGTERVTGVVLADGEIVPADVVVIGVGSLPNVEWLAGSGLTVDGGLVCDGHGWTGVGQVYGVGDCAAWDDADLGRPHRIEHWTDSRDRPARVARALLGRPDAAPLPVPYVWSDQYGIRIQFAGRLRGDEELVVDSGSVAGRDLLAVYHREGRPVAVLGLNRPREIARWRRRLITPQPTPTENGATA